MRQFSPAFLKAGQGFGGGSPRRDTQLKMRCLRGYARSPQKKNLYTFFARKML